jgi:hypothetical protein
MGTDDAEIVRRSRRAVAAGNRHIARAVSVCADAFQLTARAAEVREAARATRLASYRDAGVTWFRIEGLVGNDPVWADWREGSLTGDPSLLALVGAIVAVRDEFGEGDGMPAFHASLTNPPEAVMLTISRACDRVTAVEFQFSRLGAA